MFRLLKEIAVGWYRGKCFTDILMGYWLLYMAVAFIGTMKFSVADYGKITGFDYAMLAPSFAVMAVLLVGGWRLFRGRNPFAPNDPLPRILVALVLGGCVALAYLTRELSPLFDTGVMWAAGAYYGGNLPGLLQ